VTTERKQDNAVCVMDFAHCTESECDLWARCPHQTDKRQVLADAMKSATVRLYPEG
jgi:hypothetical protein